MKNLYRLAYRLTGQRDHAEDLVQDLMLKVYPRLQEMQRIERLAPWLSRVLYRLFIDQYRQQQRSPVSLMGDDEVIYESYASDSAGPLETADTALNHQRLSAAMQQLGEEHRMLIMLHDAEGYSLQEINQITGIPIGTIKSRLSRARNKLREIIQNREPETAASVNMGKGQ